MDVAGRNGGSHQQPVRREMEQRVEIGKNLQGLLG
jgi:hypothetical protein